MTEVKVLIEGYAKEVDGGWLASSTTTLIRESGKLIIVDPGTNKKLLLQKIKNENIDVSDIDIVFLTHYHPDHMLQTAMFTNAVVIDGETVFDKDKETGYSGKIPGTDLTVITTPGHSLEHSTIIADTKQGKVAICSDVFWWHDGQQKDNRIDVLMNLKDPFAVDEKALNISRTKVLEIADWVIPGHGRMFKNPLKA